MYWRRVGLFSLYFLVTSYCSAATLTSFSLQKSPSLQSNQVVFNFSVTPKYHYFILSHPDRVVFDFVDTKVVSEIKNMAAQSNFIKHVRYAKHGDRKLRLVLDVANGTKINVLKSKAKQLVFKLYSKTASSNKGRKSKPAAKPVVVKPPSKAYQHVKSLPLRDVVVVIDPGHGGKDPGAVGRRHVQEKRVVLAIAKKLKALIDKQPAMKAYLTRKSDYYISLRTRLALARKYNADIFISIHADAYRNTRSRGASVFALSQRGATSEAARWIAAKENYSELGGVDLSELDDDNGMVRSVLIDLSQTATIGASLSLGENVLSNLDNIADLHHRSVEQARFVVLKSPDIPSILVETGFISNQQEERLLASSRYQQRLAQSILRGVKHYFNQHPPTDSYLAHKTKTYTVVRGDTLSVIAHRLGTSVTAIKKVNKISRNMLYIGQKLVLPIS